MRAGLILLSLTLSLIPAAHARLIELGGRVAFTEAEERMVELANEGFRAELEALEWRIRIEKRGEDERGSRTEFGGKRITIAVTGDVRDPFDFAGTFCHELGHILSHSALVTAEGRVMREYVPGYTNVEGECDYFAASKCVPRIAAALPVVPIHELCRKAPDPARCSVVAETGLRTVNSMIRKDRHHARGPVDFRTPTWDMDPAATYSGYGDFACRLRTFFAGGWCEADPLRAFSPESESANACMKGPGARPRCWHVPGTAASASRYGN